MILRVVNLFKIDSKSNNAIIYIKTKTAAYVYFYQNSRSKSW